MMHKCLNEGAIVKYISGAYAAFSAGGVHFKRERTSCQQSLKYISLYNTEGAPFSTEKRNIFCVRKIRKQFRVSPAQIVGPKARVGKGGPGACSPAKFSFSKVHILRILRKM